MTTKIRIIDLKLRENGILYCYAQDADTGERIISADLEYITVAAKQRKWEILDAQDVLLKIALNFHFVKHQHHI